MISAPRTAPLRFPIPPSTAAVNAIRPELEAGVVADVELDQVEQPADAGEAAREQRT